MVLVIGLGKSKTLLVPSDRATRFPNTFSDEILYNAKIHPEQYSNTLSAAQVKQLHKSIQYICNFAVDHLSDSSTFPEEWLFKHRWGKGKKDSLTTLPNGAKFVYLKVGGRTSCVVPSVQKKTGPVAKDVDEGDDEDQDFDEEEEKPEPKAGKKASKTKKENVDESAAEPAKKSTRGKKSGTTQEGEPAEKLAVANREDKPVTKANQSKKRKAKSEMKIENNSKTEDRKASEEGSKPGSKKRKSNVRAEADDQDITPKKQKKGKADANGTKDEAPEESGGRRRSGRVSGKGV